MSQRRYWISVIVWIIIYGLALFFMSDIIDAIKSRFNVDIEEPMAQMAAYAGANFLVDLIFALALFWITFRRLGPIDHSRIWCIFVFLSLMAGLIGGLNGGPLGVDLSPKKAWLAFAALGFIVYIGLRSDSRRPDLTGPIPIICRLTFIITAIILSILSFEIVLAAPAAIPGVAQSIAPFADSVGNVIGYIEALPKMVGIKTALFHRLLAIAFLVSLVALWIIEGRNAGEIEP